MADIFAGMNLSAGVLNGILTALFSGKAGHDTVAASQDTPSTTYTDLATVGPDVTLTSAGSLALVIFACRSFVTTTAQGALMSVAVSGATTTAASDDWAHVSTQNSSGSGQGACQFAWFTITPGSNTYTAKYKLAAGVNAANFVSRRMLVIAP